MFAPRQFRNSKEFTHGETVAVSHLWNTMFAWIQAVYADGGTPTHIHRCAFDAK
jgi:hypothetical protein